MEALVAAIWPFIPPPLRVTRQTLNELPSFENLKKYSRQSAQLIRAQVSTKAVLRLAVWTGLAWLALRIGFGLVFLILSMIIMIFRNLGDDSGRTGDTPSAYSIFNRGVKAILGSLSAEQFENEIRHRPQELAEGAENEEERDVLGRDHVEGDFLRGNGEGLGPKVRRSKLANQICPCNSGKKFKKCCGRGL